MVDRRTFRRFLEKLAAIILPGQLEEEAARGRQIIVPSGVFPEVGDPNVKLELPYGVESPTAARRSNVKRMRIKKQSPKFVGRGTERGTTAIIPTYSETAIVPVSADSGTTAIVPVSAEPQVAEAVTGAKKLKFKREPVRFMKVYKKGVPPEAATEAAAVSTAAAVQEKAKFLDKLKQFWKNPWARYGIPIGAAAAGIGGLAYYLARKKRRRER